MKNFTPRWFQSEAIDSTIRLFAEGMRRVLFVCPTGGGKSATFCMLGEWWLANQVGRVLLITDRTDLSRQGRDNFRKYTDCSVGLEAGEDHVNPSRLPAVVCANIQSLGAKKLAQFDRDAFGLILFDEADLSAAPSYKRVSDYFAGALVWGCTATPFRLDGQPLVGPGCMYEARCSTVDLLDLVEKGILVQPRRQLVDIDGVDLRLVKTGRGGDYSDEALESVLMEDSALFAVAKPTLDLSGNRPTILFGATVAHAQALADVLNRYRPNSAAAVHGEMDPDERKRVIDPFRAGDFQFLCNCSLLSRGVDLPFVSCVAVARPTTSKALLMQMVGRGTRPSPQTGKSDLLVLEFSPKTASQSLVSVVDLIGGDLAPEVRERVERVLKRDPEQTVIDAIAEAERQVAEERRRAVLADARYTARAVGVYGLVQSLLGITPRPGRHGGAPPKPDDVAYVEQYGKGIHIDGLDGGQVAEIRAALQKRKDDKDRATFNQALRLLQKGLDPDVSRRAADIAMDVLNATGWQVTPQLRHAFDLVAEQRAKVAELAGERDADRAAALETEIADINSRRVAAFNALRRAIPQVAA